MREDWIEIELNRIGDILTGGTPSKKVAEYYSDNDYPFYKPTDLNKGYLVKSSTNFLSELGFQNSRNADEGSILVTCIGATIGKTGLIKKAGAFNQQINAISPYKNILSEYLYFQIVAPEFQEQIKKNASSTTLPILNKGKFSKLPILLPPLPEQRAIVAKIEQLFSSLDQGIADLKKAQEQLKVYRQAVLKKAFEGELTREWREQQTHLPTAEELLAQIKEERQKHYEQQLTDWKQAVKTWEENGKEGKKPGKPRPLTVPDPPNAGHEERKWDIPSDWIWTQIGELCFVTKLAGFEYTDYVTYVEDGDLPVIKAENAGSNGFKKTDFSKVKSESVAMLTRSQLFGGELLVVFVGAGTGNVAMVPLNQRYFLGPNIGMARPYFEINSKFLELFLQSAFGKSLMMSAVKAVAQPSLSMGTIRQAPVVFPSLKEQHQIVKEIESRLSVCEQVEQSIVESLAKADALRQSILKKAFEGTLLSDTELAATKQAPDYEPASVLLERIKKEKKK